MCFLFAQVRASGKQAASKDILRFAPLFEDELTLDNLNREQLQALCKMLLLPTVGPDPFLRFHLRMKMRRLEKDDQVGHPFCSFAHGVCSSDSAVCPFLLYCYLHVFIIFFHKF